MLNNMKNFGPVSYSRYVVFMKLLLPAIALTLVGLVFIWPQISIKDNRFSLKFNAIQGSSDEDLEFDGSGEMHPVQVVLFFQ